MTPLINGFLRQDTSCGLPNYSSLSHYLTVSLFPNIAAAVQPKFFP